MAHGGGVVALLGKDALGRGQDGLPAAILGLIGDGSGSRRAHAGPRPSGGQDLTPSSRGSRSTPNSLSVARLTGRICSTISSVLITDAPRHPKPPASETSPTRRSATPPMPASITGCSAPRASVHRVPEPVWGRQMTDASVNNILVRPTSEPERGRPVRLVGPGDRQRCPQASVVVLLAVRPNEPRARGNRHTGQDAGDRGSVGARRSRSRTRRPAVPDHRTNLIVDGRRRSRPRSETDRGRASIGPE